MYEMFMAAYSRWLSTLLLKQGYRIEYAAASDAETYAPEGFNEFFNQRRRWTPSSIANTVDLLADYQVSQFISRISIYFKLVCNLFLISVCLACLRQQRLYLASLHFVSIRSDWLLHAWPSNHLLHARLCTGER